MRRNRPTQTPNQPFVQTKEIIRETQVIVKIRCKYCTSLYDELLDRCPYCGAPRK